MTTIKATQYRWHNLSPVVRQYVVRDNNGRFGIASADHRADNVIFAHPIDVDFRVGVTDQALPSNAVIMTDTAFHLRDGKWSGTWHDGKETVTLTVVSALGIHMPDKIADTALAGSDKMGHWDYGAKLGKVGGEPPVKGQTSNEMTVEQAEDYASQVGESVTKRGIRLAAKNGYIPGSRKVGRDWLITYEGFNHYLDNRPKRGPKSQKPK